MQYAPFVATEDMMQVRKKKASTSKTNAKKSAARKSTVKKSSSAKARTTTPKVKAKAKVTPRGKKLKVATRKKPTVKLAKAKKPTVRAKTTAKTAVARAVRSQRKAPIARKDAPKPRSRATRGASLPSAPSPITSVQETHAADSADVVTQAPPPLAHFELSREPVRGGLHDGANHSRPEVQLQKQHLQTTRKPGGRPTMRGH